MNETIMRIFRFGTVGGLATLAYFVVASGLTFLWPGHELGVSLLAYSLCIALSYTLQRTVTFRSRGVVKAEATRFTLVSVFGLLVSSAIVLVSTSVLNLSPYTAYLLVLVTIPVANYVLFSRYVFQ